MLAVPPGVVRAKDLICFKNIFVKKGICHIYTILINSNILIGNQWQQFINKQK